MMNKEVLFTINLFKDIQVLISYTVELGNDM